MRSQNSSYTSLRKRYPRTWRIWFRMNYRCKHGQGKHGDYLDVDVCSEWNRDDSGEEGFLNFLDDMGPSEKHKEIDRINPLYGYEPTNCRWVDPAVNRRNTRARQRGDYKMLDVARRNGITAGTFYSRLKLGWHPQDAATLSISSVKYKRRLI